LRRAPRRGDAAEDEVGRAPLPQLLEAERAAARNGPGSAYRYADCSLARL